MKTTAISRLLLSVFFLLSLLSSAQQGTTSAPTAPKSKEHRESRRDNIESMKIAFLTRKLDLTPEEAQQFWPVYNQYTDKLQELRKKRRMESKDAKHNVDEMSDKDVEQSVDNEMVFRQKELDIQKEYHAKFKAVLPVKKVAKLYQAEEQFKRVLLDELKRDKPPVKEGN
jgi:DNA-binding MarR family transcriptional regulator